VLKVRARAAVSSSDFPLDSEQSAIWHSHMPPTQAPFEARVHELGRQIVLIAGDHATLVRVVRALLHKAALPGKQGMRQGAACSKSRSAAECQTVSFS
jgi:hypothetical protein